MQRLEELDTANRALKSDQKSLEDLQDLAYKMTEAVYERLDEEAAPPTQGPAGEATSEADADGEYLDD